VKDTEIVRCPHCDGDGTQEGPGGLEPCCHCHGKGEQVFGSPDDADVARASVSEKCRECGVYPTDHKGVCEGCLAYREHQQ